MPGLRESSLNSGCLNVLPAYSGSDRCRRCSAVNQHTGRWTHAPQVPHITNTQVRSAWLQISCSPALCSPCLRTGQLTQPKSYSTGYRVKSQGGRRQRFSALSLPWRRPLVWKLGSSHQAKWKEKPTESVPVRNGRGLINKNTRHLLSRTNKQIFGKGIYFREERQCLRWWHGGRLLTHRCKNKMPAPAVH